MQARAELLDFQGCTDFLVEIDGPLDKGQGQAGGQVLWVSIYPTGVVPEHSLPVYKEHHNIYLLHKIE